MKKFVCDHCGKEINKAEDCIDYVIEFEDFYFDCDLCAECRDKIITDTRKAIEKFIGV